MDKITYSDVEKTSDLNRKRLRNTFSMVRESISNYKSAVEKDLMQLSIKARKDKYVVLPNGREVVEFANCSYLGLDLHPKVLEAYKSVDPQWGVNFCCARSRFSIEPMRLLEDDLSNLYRGFAITFPSVTTTHLSVMPLLASGILIDEKSPPKVEFIFDRFAHSSMQYLKPILAEESTVKTIKHNSIEDLEKCVLEAKFKARMPIYVADGVYSMGGICPIREILTLAEKLDFYVYLDDAHGTTIFGENGQGTALSQINGKLPDRLFLAFCLSKGFGVNGGGILVSNKRREQLIRSYGQIYAFSAAMDFSVVNASRAVVQLHYDQTTIPKLQKDLRERVKLFDAFMGKQLPFSPIRMVRIGHEKDALKVGQQLINKGYFVPVVFFPIVPRGEAQLRICIAANHTDEQILGITSALKELKYN